MPNDIFCTFKTTYAGMCGKWLGKNPPKELRCKRHLNKKEIIRVKGKRFSGDSKWREDQGMFQAK